MESTSFVKYPDAGVMGSGREQVHYVASTLIASDSLRPFFIDSLYSGNVQ